MGCCTSGSQPLTQNESTDLLPPLEVKKTLKKEDLKLRPANYVLRVREDLREQYTIVKQIGQGGFGTVFTAVHKETGQPRAVKTISKGFMDDSAAETMLREVSITRNLVPSTQDHPNIIKVFEVIEDPMNFHIVSELCTGGDLFDNVVAVSHFSESVVAKYMRQILSAIAYCHEARVVHRDLKPENLLLESNSPDAQLKIIDFGTSSKLQPHHRLRGVIGTVFYMAPEVLTGRYDEKCDIWSCGVIMYILLCTCYSGGKPPFGGKADEEIAENIVKGEVNMDGELWDEVSLEAKEFVMKMLTKEPTARPSAKELLREAWISEPETPMEQRRIKSEVLNTLKSFRAGCRFRVAALQYIAWQLAPVESTAELKRVFLSLDADMDGKLSIEDLERGFRQVNPTSIVDIPSIVKTMDSDGSGFIDYHEFLVAAMNWSQILTADILETAFKAFDQDRNGKIGVEDVRVMLEGEQDVDSPVWADLLRDADSDRSGAVTSTTD